MKRNLRVMVNNSTNINKTNNHISPYIIEHNKKYQHIWCGGVTPVKGVPVFLIFESPNGNKDINKRWQKNLQHKHGEYNSRLTTECIKTWTGNVLFGQRSACRILFIYKILIVVINICELFQIFMNTVSLV